MALTAQQANTQSKLGVIKPYSGGLLTNNVQLQKNIPNTQASTTQSKLGVNQSIGVRANSPDLNVQKPQTTIDTKYQAPASTQSSSFNLTPSAAQNQMSLTSPQQATPQPEQPKSKSPTYEGLIGQLVKSSSQPSAAFERAYKEAQKINEQLQMSKTNQANSLYDNFTNPIPLEFQQGRGQVLTDQYLAQQNALASQFAGQSNLLGAANTQQATQQAGLLGAAGLAQPQLAGYNQQAFNPLTGTFSGGDLSGAVSNIAQRVQAGQMSYDDAVSALGGYGQGGVNALQQALGPNFNVAQSNTLAQQQGSIGPAVQYADAAAQNLEAALSGLGSLQQTNVPLINQLVGSISGASGIGSQQTQAYKAAIAEARNAIQRVLASQAGGTPTDYVGQSNALLPDNATPNQVRAAIETLRSLGQSRQQIYGNPGYSGSQSSGGSIWDF